jgi:hypothetical protein
MAEDKKRLNLIQGREPRPVGGQPVQQPRENVNWSWLEEQVRARKEAEGGQARS